MLAGWLVVASFGRDADAQRRPFHMPGGPDEATIRRCGQPLLMYPEMAGEPRYRWPPTSPCFQEQERQRRAVQVFWESRTVATCWQNLLRLSPSLGGMTVRITLLVDVEGRITDVRGEPSPDPRFASCLRQRSALIAPLGPGLSVLSAISVGLANGG